MLARDQVYNKLRDWIVAGELQPGETLQYDEIAQQLGVSHTPIREAFLRLSHEGFIDIAHNRWTRVASVDVGKAAEGCLVVEALEGLALELALPTLRAKDVRHLRVLNEGLRGALASGDMLEGILSDEAFHHVWIRQAGNQEIAGTLERLKARLQRVEWTFFATEVQPPSTPDEHDVMIDAIAHKNTFEATRLLREHWRRRFERLQRVTFAEPAA